QCEIASENIWAASGVLPESGTNLILNCSSVRRTQATALGDVDQMEAGSGDRQTDTSSGSLARSSEYGGVLEESSSPIVSRQWLSATPSAPESSRTHTRRASYTVLHAEVKERRKAKGASLCCSIKPPNGPALSCAPPVKGNDTSGGRPGS